MSIASNHFILSCLLLLLPSVFPNVGVFSIESALPMRWPKYWSFSISPSNEYSGLISFKIEWFDFLAVQGTLKSLLQHQCSKASIFQHSAFLWSSSHIRTWLLERPQSWLYGPLSAKWFVVTFLPRSSLLSISWLQSLSTVILEPKKRNSVTAATFSLSICHEWWNWMPNLSFF